ncbi:hypothetical protein FIBSPDRAFT_953770 [Athelia psychrophila]|uniref:Uncharacterized protein n=1 Tax=Athelia psychrophila TaxID=1759441 RepID=A0A166JVV0_9AGAM|nr:hypothetical protein FIBSPDRAFT_953770 [Fibularhizoctonia sp. CBS 109695]
MSQALRPRSSRPSDSATGTALDIGDEDDAVRRIRSGSLEDILPSDDEAAEEDSLEDDAETLAASGRPVKPLPKSKGKAKAKSPQTRAPQTGPHAGPSLPRTPRTGFTRFLLSAFSIATAPAAVLSCQTHREVDATGKTICSAADDTHGRRHRASWTQDNTHEQPDLQQTVQDRVHRGWECDVGLKLL